MRRVLLLLLLAVSAAAETTEELRAHALKLIHRDRTKHNLRPLKHDPALSKLAEERARQLVAGNDDGYPTYMRYSLRGHDDAIRENIAGWSVTYSLTDAAMRELVRQAQEWMLGELPPLDGRKGTILDPFATHVGAGFATSGGEFRIVQLFTRRHVLLGRPIPRASNTAESVLVTGRPLGEAAFDSITVHFEPEPDATPKRAEKFPERRKEYLPRLGSKVRRYKDGKVDYLRDEYGEGRYGEIDVTKEGAFSFAVPFTEGPGIYTIVVWVRVPDWAYPFAATNSSIRVEESPVVPALP